MARDAARKGHHTALFFVEKAPGLDMRGVIGPGPSRVPRLLVREDCAEWALERDESGIWGGMTKQERRAVRKGQPAV